MVYRYYSAMLPTINGGPAGRGMKENWSHDEPKGGLAFSVTCKVAEEMVRGITR